MPVTDNSLWNSKFVKTGFKMDANKKEDYNEKQNAYLKKRRDFLTNYYYLALNPYGVVSIEDFCIFKVPKRFKNHRNLTNENSMRNAAMYKFLNSEVITNMVKNTHYLVGPLETKQGIIRELNLSIKWVRTKRKEQKKALHREQKELPKEIKKAFKEAKTFVNQFDPSKEANIKPIEDALKQVKYLYQKLQSVNEQLEALKPQTDYIGHFADKGISSKTYEETSQSIQFLDECLAFRESWFPEYGRRYGQLIGEEF